MLVMMMMKIMIMIFTARKLSYKSGFQRDPENSIKLQYICSTSTNR